MTRLLLVEDEPSAARYLRSIIETRCTGIESVETAENGAEALAKARELLPDIVLTDIRMPVMNGIELAARLGEELPFIYTVIISGYQEFEYARRALTSGVVDYLLKPVNAKQLADLVDALNGKLARDYYEERVSLLSRARAGGAPEEWRVRRYLPFATYLTALAREGPPPGRYKTHQGATHIGQAISTSRADMERLGIWALAGRDTRELFLVTTPELGPAEAFRQWLTALPGAAGETCVTVCLRSGSCGFAELGAAEESLRRILDRSIVLGRPQVIHGEPRRARVTDVDPATDPALHGRIEYLLANARWSELEEELRHLIGAWEADQRPLLTVESGLRQIFLLLARRAPRNTLEAGEIEVLFDEAFQTATTHAELADRVWAIAARILQCTDDSNPDAPPVLASVEAYLRANYPAPLSLPSVCESFGVSQTYLSRLMRRHLGTTFTDFLTGIRIEAAKRLIRDNPKMPLKDVAAFVGYRDQFYFSRVFKQVVGVPPSELPPEGTRTE